MPSLQVVPVEKFAKNNSTHLTRRKIPIPLGPTGCKSEDGERNDDDGAAVVAIATTMTADPETTSCGDSSNNNIISINNGDKNLRKRKITPLTERKNKNKNSNNNNGDSNDMTTALPANNKRIKKAATGVAVGQKTLRDFFGCPSSSATVTTTTATAVINRPVVTTATAIANTASPAETNQQHRQQPLIITNNNNSKNTTHSVACSQDSSSSSTSGTSSRRSSACLDRLTPDRKAQLKSIVMGRRQRRQQEPSVLQPSSAGFILSSMGRDSSCCRSRINTSHDTSTVLDSSTATGTSTTQGKTATVDTSTTITVSKDQIPVRGVQLLARFDGKPEEILPQSGSNDEDDNDDETRKTQVAKTKDYKMVSNKDPVLSPIAAIRGDMHATPLMAVVTTTQAESGCSADDALSTVANAHAQDEDNTVNNDDDHIVASPAMNLDGPEINNHHPCSLTPTTDTLRDAQIRATSEGKPNCAAEKVIRSDAMATDDGKKHDALTETSGGESACITGRQDGTSACLSNDERTTLIHKHAQMQEKYRRDAVELLEQCMTGLAEEEQLNLQVASNDAAVVPSTTDGNHDNVSSDNSEFPDFIVAALATMVESRSETLTGLALRATAELRALYSHISFDQDVVAAKIKVMATRKNYIKDPFVIQSEAINRTSDRITKSAPVTNSIKLNVFENNETHYMWRWEITVVELLPPAAVGSVKEARAARRKIANHFQAVARLLRVLQEADTAIRTETTESSNDPEHALLLAKVSREEEKVLKFERDKEKARLAAAAKRTKEATRKAKEQLQREQRQQEKKKELEQKRLEKAQDKQRHKEQQTAAKEQARLEKAREQEEKIKKDKEKQEALEVIKKKQSSRFTSFFSSAQPSSSSKSHQSQQDVASRLEAPCDSKPPAAEPYSDPLCGFDVDRFRARIQSSTPTPGGTARDLFLSRSIHATMYRRRRTQRVTVPVFVTVYPEDPFAMQPYDERREVEILNKYRFLHFHEDIRPAYYGTWSKRSAVVSGRRPMARDATHLDYDYDSEAEWEEGDDEVGEDIENDQGGDDDDDDKVIEDDEEMDGDGWLAADDEIDNVLGEEVDEETKLLRKKKVEERNRAAAACQELKVCIITPDHGRPLDLKTADPRKWDGFYDGFDYSEALAWMNQCMCTTLSDADIYLDAFPPQLVDESDSGGGPELSEDEMKAFARFIHCNTTGSKDKLVDEFRSDPHFACTGSRALTLRVLESIADKKKQANSGLSYWEVKSDILKNLQLDDLLKDRATEIQDAQKQAMRTIATFVHHSSLTSKDKVVDELRNTHPTVTSSRAEALRTIESMAEKKRHGVYGVYWHVKAHVRHELGLGHLPDELVVAEAASTDSVP